MHKLSLACLLLFCFSQVAAKEVAGVSIAEQIQREADHAELVLNGAGVRKKFFFKIYIAALYLEQRTGDVSSVMASEGAARVEMRILYSKVEQEKFVEGWNEGFTANLTQEEMNQVRERLERFNGMFETLQEGDLIELDYFPAKGTGVRIKGVEKGVIPGADFFQALLKVWLGDKPVNESLKQNLLGHY